MSGENVHLLRHGLRREVGFGLGKTVSSTSDGGSVGPRCQGKEVGCDLLEMSGSGFSRFVAVHLKILILVAAVMFCVILSSIISKLLLKA